MTRTAAFTGLVSNRCDTRSFTWIVHKATRGSHVVRILWGMGNPTSANVSNRTLAIEAARLE